MSEKKQFHLKSIDVDGAGHVKAVFATLGVVDHDQDIVMPGATESGTKVRISAYNHASWNGALPVGKGIIAEVGNELHLDGEFFLKTTHGRDTYETVKELGDLAEWSYGFDIIEKDYATDPATGQEIRRIKKQKIYEVSPVLLGAGLNTRTLDLKGLSTDSKTYQEHADALLETVSDFVQRSQSIAELRAEKGKEPASQKNREGLKALAAELGKAAGELKRLAETDTEAEEAKAKAEAVALFAQIDANELVRSAV